MTNDQSEPDGILRTLVAVMNAVTEPLVDGIGITLTLSGQVVSGKLIPDWKWFEDSAAHFSNEKHRSEEGEQPGGLEFLLTEAHKAAAERAKQKAAAREAAADLDQRYKDAIIAEDVVRYVHLMDARVFAPGHAGMPSDGMYWRGRLTDVAGWAFGLFQFIQTTD